MPKKRSKKSKEQTSGFKEIPFPYGSGYEKPLPSGRRKHKYTKTGPYHIDKANPRKNPLEHFTRDVVGKRVKNLKRKFRK